MVVTDISRADTWNEKAGGYFYSEEEWPEEVLDKEIGQPQKEYRSSYVSKNTVISERRCNKYA